jgi:GNAT superfamily N-acetyltransferase
MLAASQSSNGGQPVSPAVSKAGPRSQRRDEGEPVTLSDGGRLIVRPLHDYDRKAYAAAVATMSPRSRYLRFAAPKPRFSDRELDFLTHPDGDRHVALVALDPDTRHGVAVARYVCSDEHTADVALGVVDDWQSRGVGSLLLARLIEHARAAGLSALTATALAENEPSLRMLRRNGFVLAAAGGITNDYRLALSAPTARG